MSFSKLLKKALDNPTEFNVWTTLLDLVEKQQNIDHARKAFENFFDHFPYCYGYWKKWADMERHKGNKEEALNVYEKGVKAVPLSIDLWTAYLDAAVDLYEEALEAAGLEFRSDALWEHYIGWETSHNLCLVVAFTLSRYALSYSPGWPPIHRRRTEIVFDHCYLCYSTRIRW
ncbi:unnamed protein product [Echinostoma caproni]|uniref:TPR_REGION domain-containing protein n=1 Tax=Echinostoma caproni TaxID=27848 RepID=A0A183B4I6_9TREM|nr:unnamed protein product [Echinostoma caproni]